MRHFVRSPRLRPLLAALLLSALSGCSYGEKNYYYYYGGLDSGAEQGEPADDAGGADGGGLDDSGADGGGADGGAIDSGEPAPEGPVERVWAGYYEVINREGEVVRPELRLGMTLESEGDDWGELRTLYAEDSGGVVYDIYPCVLRLELAGAIGPTGFAEGGALNRPAPDGEPSAPPRPWVTTVEPRDDAPPRLEIASDVSVMVMGFDMPYPFTAVLELQPLE
jgi:hypothetical protein